MKQVKLVGTMAPATVLGVLGLMASHPANAGCPTYSPPATAPATAHQTPAVYHPDSGLGGAYTLAGDLGTPAIVRLWKFKFLAKGNTNGIPDGALIDFGTAQWHEDDSETMISGGRKPSDGDVCMGVRQQVGRPTFSLTHVALAYHAGA